MTIKRSDLRAMKFGKIISGRHLAPVHPGEVLLADFIEPLGLTRYRVAKAIGVPQRRIDEICSGKRAVTADTALRLGRFFTVEPQLWMTLQAQYDLEIAEREWARAANLEIVPLKNAA
ncbi:MAG TPA: HigA family addiction module antitoxin [Usitatibacter sp.]|nr:HigA family addiction module antitoxin [Usitatibacter sp.]